MAGSTFHTLLSVCVVRSALSLRFGGVARNSVGSQFKLVYPEAPLGNRSQFMRGVVYIKTKKTASSTFAGVLRRIAKRHGLRQTSPDDIFHEERGIMAEYEDSGSLWAYHGSRRYLEPLLTSVMPDPIFITTLRDPVEARLSAFYFRVSRGEVEPSVANKLAFLSTSSTRELCNYISASSSDSPLDILHSYDFISVSERFDESLVLLSRYFNTSLVDLLYLSAKRSNAPGTDVLDRDVRYVRHPPIAEEPAEVRKAAERLSAPDSPDVQVVALANKALDEKIVAYGPDFSADFQDFQKMLKEVERVCRPHFFESCFWNDNGCGQACIDTLAETEGWTR